MKRSIQKIILGLGVCGVVGIAGAADASACGKGKGGGHANRLLKMDTNQDGALTKSELTEGFYAHVTKKLERADANKDGYIDRGEMTAMREQFRARRAEKKGAMNPERQAKFAARFEKRIDKRFAKSDTDGDGRLGVQEMQAAADRRVTKMFERLDPNQDGKIEQAELAAAKGKRGKHGKRHGKRHGGEGEIGG